MTTLVYNRLKNSMLTHISPNIYISDYEDERDRPRLGYIHGTSLSVMIDAGASKDHAESFLAELQAHHLPKPQFVLLTHWHWDHVFGLHALPFTSICTHATQQKLIEMSQWHWDDASMAKRIELGEDIAFCDEHIRKEYPDRSLITVKPAQLTFEDHFNFHSGNLDIQAFKLPNDHSSDACVVFIPQERVLFLGDIISPDFHHGDAHYTYDHLNGLIQALQALDFDQVVHGHTEVYTKSSLLDELYAEIHALETHAT